MSGRGIVLGMAIVLIAVTAAPVPGQDTALSAELEREILATALAFYSPPRGQVRWIESEDPALQPALVARLGERFLPWTEGARGPGGRLRFSPIEIVEPGRYRVSVSYRHRTPYHEGPLSTQTFLVGCDGSGCRILARGPGGAEHGS